MANSSSGESVIERVARMLHAFDAEHRELSSSQLAQRAQLSPSTAHRLATSMTEVGLLQRVGRGKFRIGLGLWEAGQRGTLFQTLSEHALPFMEAIHVTLKHNVSLSILDADAGEVVYLERLTHRGVREDLTKVALRHPVLSVSSGLIILAYSQPELRERFLTAPWDEATLRSGVTEQHLRRRLAQARIDGYIHLRGVMVSSLSGLAVPVFDDRGKVVASIAIVQDLADVNLKVQVPVLLSAARGLSRMSLTVVNR